MSYFYSIFLFFQTLFVILNKVVPETQKITTLGSKVIICFLLLYLTFFDGSLIELSFNRNLLVPLLFEYLLFSICVDTFKVNKKRIYTIQFNELAVLFLFLSTAEVNYLVKVSILVCSYLLESYKLSFSEQTSENQQSFFSSMLCGFLTLGLVLCDQGSIVSRTILLLLIPLNFYLFPFSILRTESRGYPYSLSQRLFSVFLFMEMSRVQISLHSIEFVLPVVALILGLGLLHKKKRNIMKTGKLGIEFLFLICFVYLPNFNPNLIMADYYWLCFFLSIPYLLTQAVPVFLRSVAWKILTLIFFLGILPGPFANIFDSLIEHSRLFGSYALVLAFLGFYTVFLMAYFARLTLDQPSSETPRSFGPFNSILMVSTIIIGVILSI